MIKAEIGLRNIGSVIALGKVCTSVRYLMTLQRHWPDVEKMLVAINYFGHPPEEWPDHPATRAPINGGSSHPTWPRVSSWIGVQLSEDRR